MLIQFAFVLSAIGCCTSSAMNDYSKARVKKIINGEPLPSLAIYGTYYHVQLRHTWACTAEATKHDMILQSCQENLQRCGGTLIHPEFVMTAASCVMYYEVVVKDLNMDDIRRQTEDPNEELYDLLERIRGHMVGYVYKPKSQHTVYSDWTLLAGGSDLYNMTQKRHVVNVFPHSKFPQDFTTANLERLFRLSRSNYHDVALLQACLPFDIKDTVKVAPMLLRFRDLRNQYDHIVTTGQVCLYIGFGLRGENETKIEGGPPRFIKHVMQHTWRPSKCYTECNFDRLGYLEQPHSCHLCSWHHGPNLGAAESGDVGGPVTCGGYFVATVTVTGVEKYRNFSRTDSYPLHCIKKAIMEDRLEYYRTAEPGGYHPLSDRHRRFPLPPD